jgi:hypothetical protein
MYRCLKNVCRNAFPTSPAISMIIASSEASAAAACPVAWVGIAYREDDRFRLTLHDRCGG